MRELCISSLGGKTNNATTTNNKSTRVTSALKLFGTAVMAVLVAGVGSTTTTFANADKTCRFADSFKTEEILKNREVRDAFFKAHARMESRFMKHAGLDHKTKLTLDGQPLDVESGLPFGSPHMFSAASKECLHLAVLAQAINDHPIALEIYDHNKTEVLDLLRHKVASYEKFNREYPGFGGFLPWFALDGKGGMTPTWDFQNKVPSLDNGEMLWAAFAVAEALRLKYHTTESKLIADFDLIWRRMVKNAIPIFYEDTFGLRTVTQMTNQSLPVDQNKYWSAGSSATSPLRDQPYTNGNYLDDPYEGELFVVALYLFSDELSDQQKEQLWVAKRPNLQKVDLVLTTPTAKKAVKKGRKLSAQSVQVADQQQPQPPALKSPASGDTETTTITVERGFWFSAHEKWKYLFLPYHKAINNWRVFKNGERARTHYARSVKARGLWASVNGPITNNTQNGGYFSDCGIESISFNQVTHDDVITPYGAFPLFLLGLDKEKKMIGGHNGLPDAEEDTEGVAAAWLHHMISVRQGQNCFGTTEGFNVTGSSVAPLVTWDTKITTVVAAMRGNVDLVSSAFDRFGVTSKFVDVINKEWGMVFGDAKSTSTPLPGEHLPFLGPVVEDVVPRLLKDFTSCRVDGPSCPQL